MMSGSMALIWSLDVWVSSPKTRYDSALPNDRGNINYSVENRIQKFKYTTLLRACLENLKFQIANCISWCSFMILLSSIKPWPILVVCATGESAQWKLLLQWQKLAIMQNFLSENCDDGMNWDKITNNRRRVKIYIFVFLTIFLKRLDKAWFCFWKICAEINFANHHCTL